MKNVKRLLLFFQISVWLWIAGCAYPLSKEIKAKAREDLTYPVVAGDPDKYKGETVVWGGHIIRVRNQQDLTTLMILETPLDYWDKPLDDIEGRGAIPCPCARISGP